MKRNPQVRRWQQGPASLVVVEWRYRVHRASDYAGPPGRKASLMTLKMIEELLHLDPCERGAAWPGQWQNSKWGSEKLENITPSFGREIVELCPWKLYSSSQYNWQIWTQNYHKIPTYPDILRWRILSHGVWPQVSCKIWPRIHGVYRAAVNLPYLAGGHVSLMSQCWSELTLWFQPAF
jgi:hypothetical protein